MKTSFILALIAAFAVSSISASDKQQYQSADGNNAVVSTADGSLVGAPGLAQGGVNVLSDKTNVADINQKQKQ